MHLLLPTVRRMYRLTISLPWYYNNVLTLRERAVYMNNGVALPMPQHCQSEADIRRWKKLNTKKFMEEYGNEVLDQYDIPTEEELERLDRNEDTDNEADEDDEDDEDFTDSEDEAADGDT
ncbi:hypothetical protein BT96DRAFT_71109 [Gymnopus androsaceus JB14]|uniref:Uncharacterized protein n=1 Tax=Gymnopus androsaceus JB14 TaxID=1447944 RepID=A0A6A4HIK3_9AGAR|nr:hypothetical protein BT96DRAFT_71109 [Gymnopus androsaceus JB14]